MNSHDSSPSQHDQAIALRRAVQAVGSQQLFATLVGKTQGAISKRLAAGQSCWAEDVLKVEEATGISRHDLRPDLYPREDGAAAPEADDLLEGVRP
jgi:DNA-binding transcriptional regulator YdaS (Cro superfamily)